MTKEQLYEQLLVCDNSNDLDILITKGLECPKCGSRHFNTWQRIIYHQWVDKSRWGPVDMEDAWGDGETVIVTCVDCDHVLWDIHSPSEAG